MNEVLHAGCKTSTSIIPHPRKLLPYQFVVTSALNCKILRYLKLLRNISLKDYAFILGTIKLSLMFKENRALAWHYQIKLPAILYDIF